MAGRVEGASDARRSRILRQEVSLAQVARGAVAASSVKPIRVLKRGGCVAVVVLEAAGSSVKPLRNFKFVASAAAAAPEVVDFSVMS